MKKGIYIIYESSSVTAGVDRKINSQIRALRESGMEIQIIRVGVNKIFGWRLLYRLPFTNINPYWIWHEEYKSCDFIYMRFPSCLSLPLLRLLNKIKKENPDIRIIMELHSGIHFKHLLTVPKMYPLLLKEWICMPFLNKYVDVMTALSDYDNTKKTYHINVLPILNGLDFSMMRKREPKKKNGRIDLVIVAMMVAAHGYERLIKGLYYYYANGGRRSIKLHFVGGGEEIEKYKKYVIQYSLDDNVIFYGMKNLEEMQEIYDECDIGVSALALFRLGLTRSTLLKNKEYVAAGLPVIGAGEIDIADIPGLEKYVLQFPNEERAIDVTKIVAFYDDIYGEKTQEEIKMMIQEIRSSGEAYFDYKSAIRSVIEYVNAENK